jgi:myo-inositol-1(or 4)-monophosphatase
MPAPQVNIALRAARAAGDLITRSLNRLDDLTIVDKGRNDFVSEVDRQAEQRIVQTIRRAYPNDNVLAEEGGQVAGREPNETTWIIDPLDGTTNFLHGFPQFSVSIAVSVKGRLEHAVVYDPLRNEVFSASRGAGARLNDKRIRVTNAKGLAGALLGTGFPYRQHEHLDAYLAMFRDLLLPTAGIRRPGSAALDLAYVAAGRLDGFWEAGLRPWDMAAGALLIREAGGLVGDFGGGERFLETGNIVAGAPKVFRDILKTLRPHLPAALKA